MPASKFQKVAIIQRRQIVKRLFEQGRTNPVIARKVGVGESTIVNDLRAMGLQRDLRRWRPEDEPEVRRRLESGQSYPEVARALGHNADTLRREVPGFKMTDAEKARKRNAARKAKTAKD